MYLKNNFLTKAGLKLRFWKYSNVLPFKDKKVLQRDAAS